MPQELPEPVRTQIAEALMRGEKIGAIKLHREATHSGLKEAKDAVEELEARLRASSPEKFAATPKGGGCRGTAALLVVGLVVAGGAAVGSVWWLVG